MGTMAITITTPVLPDGSSVAVVGKLAYKIRPNRVVHYV